MRECAKVKKLLSRYIDKEANFAEDSLVRTHIANCAFCEKELSELAGVKALVSGNKRVSLPQDYMVSRLRTEIGRIRQVGDRLSWAAMGNFARRLIPIPAVALVASIVFLVIISGQPVTGDSLEEHIFSGNAATMDTALKVVLGARN
ncbi:MAG: zf-HC2 domain-containing protein [Candidatus Omnitrophica bacterium]|nr:zf-HC2 domain-containing protein [Candidatus Omnitrophota bacterium]